MVSGDNLAGNVNIVNGTNRGDRVYRGQVRASHHRGVDTEAERGGETLTTQNGELYTQSDLF